MHLKWDPTNQIVVVDGWIELTKSNAGLEFTTLQVVDGAGTSSWSSSGIKTTGGEVDLLIGAGLTPGTTPKGAILLVEAQIDYSAGVGANAIASVMLKSKGSPANYVGAAVKNNSGFARTMRYNTLSSPLYVGSNTLGASPAGVNVRFAVYAVQANDAGDSYSYEVQVDDADGTWTDGLTFGQKGAGSTLDLGDIGDGWAGLTLLADNDGGGTLDLTVKRILWGTS